MKTIKVQVSNDGFFGREANPHDKYIDGGYINEDWIQFNDTHAPLPLTTPQTPNAIIEVLEEPVWQYRTNRDLVEAGIDKEIIWKNGVQHFIKEMHESLPDSTRQAYQVVITPVPNSEPKEMVEDLSKITLKTEVRLELENNKGSMYAVLDTERSVIRLSLPDGFVELNLRESLKLSDLILGVLK